MNQNISQDLGEGLILRQATLDDAEAMAAFQGDIHRDPGVEEPDEMIATWTRDLMTRPHPTFKVGDFTLVEDTNRGVIVSAMCLISQTWSYGGVAFGVGRPELVGTHPDYRRRGLIRAQFDVIHRWSEERGEMMQVITGIPWYYRQFGYEMAMTLGGYRAGYKPNLPKLKEDQEEPFRLRPPVEADLPFVVDLYALGTQRYPVACMWDEALWRYELWGKSKQGERRDLRIVETQQGEPVGFITHAYKTWNGRLRIYSYELKPGVSWLAVTPSIVRYLWQLGEEWTAQDPKQEMTTFIFFLGAEHPAYQVARDWLPIVRPPYAWYLRVPDLAGFLRHITPVLEKRLAASPVVGHSGEFKLGFYRGGLRLVFDAGHLVELEPWQPAEPEDGDAAFPDLTFLQLLFGYRSLEELTYAFPDCWASDDSRALLEALFPKQPSHIWAVA